MSKESEPGDDNDIPPSPQIDDDIDPDTPPVIDKDIPIDDQEQKPLVTQGDWEMHVDDEGLPYFWNTKTEKSQWEAPPGWEGGKKFNKMIEEYVSTEESSPPPTSVLKKQVHTPETAKSTEVDAEKKPGLFSRVKDGIAGFLSGLKELGGKIIKMLPSNPFGKSKSDGAPQALSSHPGADGKMAAQATGQDSIEDELQLEPSQIYSQEYSLSREESVSYSPEDSVVRSVFRSRNPSISESQGNRDMHEDKSHTQLPERVRSKSLGALPKKGSPPIPSPRNGTQPTNPSIHEPPKTINPTHLSIANKMRARSESAPGQGETSSYPQTSLTELKRARGRGQSI